MRYSILLPPCLVTSNMKYPWCQFSYEEHALRYAKQCISEIESPSYDHVKNGYLSVNDHHSTGLIRLAYKAVIDFEWDEETQCYEPKIVMKKVEK